MPNARSTALLSASLSVTAPSGSARPAGIGHARRLARQQAAAVGGEAGEHRGGPRQAHRRGDERHAGGLEGLAASTDLARRPDQATCTRLVGLGGGRGDRLGGARRRAGRRSRRAGSTAGRAAGRPARSRACVVNSWHVVEHAGGDVGRVLGRAERGDHLAQRGERLRRRTAASVRPPRTAASANTMPEPPEIDSTPIAIAVRQAPLREQLGDVDDRLDVVDLDQAGLAHGGAIEVVAAGHVGGVRGGGLDAGVGGGGLPDQHRLAGLAATCGRDRAGGARRACPPGRRRRARCRGRRGRPTAARAW